MNKKFRKKFRKGFRGKILKMALGLGYSDIESFLAKEEIDLDILRRDFYDKMKAECEC